MPVRNTIGGFEADLKKFARTVNVDFGKVKRQVAFDLFGQITVETPSDTGRARASWMMSDGQPSAEVAPKGRHTAKGKVTATFSDPFENVWIVNNLPYIFALEFGHSKQAPKGMVRVALSNVEAGILSRIT